MYGCTDAQMMVAYESACMYITFITGCQTGINYNTD
jgi:hypothetical protein